MKKKLTMLLCMLLPLLVQAKSYELGVYLKNGVLLNKGAVKSTEASQNFTKFKNTFQQGLGFTYQYKVKNNIRLLAGIEAGYEKYNADLAVANDVYGKTTGEAPIAFNIAKSIFYADVQVGVGYKFTKWGKLQPEVRIGEVLRVAMNQEQINSDNYEVTGYGNNNLVFLKNGSLGSKNSVPAVDALTNLYIGVDAWQNKKATTILKVGLQVQKGLFIARPANNYLEVKYYDANGSFLSVNEFTGKHTTASVIVGLAF